MQFVFSLAIWQLREPEMLALKSLQAHQKNPVVQTKLPENAGHPRWQKAGSWKVKMVTHRKQSQ